MRLFSTLSTLSATAIALGLALSCRQPLSTSTEATPASPIVEDASSIPQVSPDTDAVETQAATDVPPAVFTEDNIAIRGADPVAYFAENRYVPGSADYTYNWADATWQFASSENRDLFAENPEQYAPQYGGFCAWAVAEGYTASVDPNAWEIVDGRLYLNYDTRIQRRWQRDVPGNIARADENWPAVLN
ncbi:YHS domain-containing (seleno)protein [cf. Phormidesmis sp. LEGE 11477]|uniref:YHS domain-containing (seleno)protein n=1 Tax=cf. Phormidesmis sp. LEGE 11477 TaxID=1828680 RepID=UPI00187F6925|nr:YHS domain-containing (seleno)protein [cf. Phormidesmis sp. LEGE 11477]MBE9061223.1 YHS domain-containing protein [cf. Phormidesmis sp. LEGE 11477]